MKVAGIEIRGRLPRGRRFLELLRLLEKAQKLDVPSWDDDPDRLRSAARRGSEPDWKMQDPQIPQSIWFLTDANFLGIRVVRPLRVPTEEEAWKYEPDPEVMWEYMEAHGGKM